MKLKGIDISQHNGNIDMKKIKDDGIQFVMIRSSYGRFYKDPLLDQNVAKCIEAGIHFGFYHYSYSRNREEGLYEAKAFLELVKKYSGRTYPLCLDMEDADHWKSNNGVTDQGNLEVIKAFKEVIEGAGEYLTLYMSKSWFDRLRGLNASLINSIDPWLAHWGISNPSMECGMWQYTSDGVVNGSSARTDLNYCYKDYPSIIAGMNNKPDNPKPETPTAPEKASEEIEEGDKVKYSGYLYADSNGNGRGKKVGGTYTVTIKNDNPYGIHLGELGWVKPSDCKKVSGSSSNNASTTIKETDRVMVLERVDYYGTVLDPYVLTRPFVVVEAKGDRIVLGDGLNTAFKRSNLKKV